MAKLGLLLLDCASNGFFLLNILKKFKNWKFLGKLPAFFYIWQLSSSRRCSPKSYYCLRTLGTSKKSFFLEKMKISSYEEIFKKVQKRKTWLILSIFRFKWDFCLWNFKTVKNFFMRKRRLFPIKSFDFFKAPKGGLPFKECLSTGVFVYDFRIGSNFRYIGELIDFFQTNLNFSKSLKVA